MALPTLTPEQRADALRKAIEARRARAELTAKIKAGVITLDQVFELADNDRDGYVARTKAAALLRALPGVGQVGAERMMREVDIAASRRVAGLSHRQRSALVALSDKSTNRR